MLTHPNARRPDAGYYAGSDIACLVSGEGAAYPDRMTDQPASPTIPHELEPTVRAHLGELLQQLLPPVTADLPGPLLELVQGLTAALASRDASYAHAFRKDLIAAMPKLRAYGISLTRNPLRADDLVQDTLLRALRNSDKFVRGSNLEAWPFTILRNGMLSDYRKHQREVEDPDGIHASRAAVAPEQVHRAGHRDLLTAFAQLSPPHREALMLVAVQGMTYDEVAEICGVPIGTIKSRVNRARVHLGKLLSEDGSFVFDGVATAALGAAATA